MSIYSLQWSTETFPSFFDCLARLCFCLLPKLVIPGESLAGALPALSPRIWVYFHIKEAN